MEEEEEEGIIAFAINLYSRARQNNF